MKRNAFAVVLVFFLMFLVSCNNGTNTISVDFDSNGGTAISSQQVSSGGKVTKPSDPTKENAVFNGWMKTNNSTDAFDFESSVTGNTVLYASWKYQTLYDKNGADESAAVPAGKSKIHGIDLVTEKPGALASARTGYTFAGWATSATYPNGNGIYVEDNGLYTLDEATKFYAYWINHDGVFYKPNGGLGSAYDLVSTTVNTFEQTGIVAKTGKTFLQWNTKADGTGTSYTPGATKPSGLVVLYAIYQ